MLLGLLAATAVAALPPPPKSLIEDPDLRCIVAVSFALATIDGGKDVDDEERSGVVALVMYYVGKIDGRMPGFDYAKEVTKLIQSPGYAESGLLGDLDRCGEEAEERGRTLKELGEQLQNLAPLLEGERKG